MKKNYFVWLLMLFPLSLFSQTPCENGTVGIYPCNQVDFYANLNNTELSGGASVSSNDIWGWTDPQTGKEYALVGQTNGTVFVDISDPSNPVVVGRLESHTGSSSTWRDIKVFNNHAYVVADSNSGHGMQVFDLTRLRNYAGTPINFDNDGHYGGVGSAHNVVINEATGFAYIVGARGASNNCGQGGLHIVDINDPKNPVFAGCFDADGYTHDAQCVIYEGPDAAYQGKEICFNANENTVTIADVTTKSNTTLISKQGYSQSAYSHQGWLTEDHQYFISNDELDERNFGNNTRTLIWDVRDLDNPKLLTEYFSERKAIDHNLYVKDSMVFQSNYTNGLIILDAKKIGSGNIRELAFFDTYPQSDNTSFDGTWSNYPFFESGIVIVSDVNNGLFILKPNIEEIVVSHPVFANCETKQTISVEIANNFTADSYQWQKIDNNKPSNLTDDSVFSGTNSPELLVNSEKGNINDLQFRCKVELSNGDIAYSYLSNSASGKPLTRFTFNKVGEEIQFFNESENFDSLQWDFGDGSPISSEENPIHTYSEIQEYTVTLTAYNSCGAKTSTQTVSETILNSRLEKRSTVNIFPNPVQDILNVNSTSHDRFVTDISVVNIEGRKVYEQKGQLELQQQINTSQWESGIYFMILTNSNGAKELKKIIKK